MSERPGYDFRGRQISPATRADWRHDSRPTNYDGGRTAILARRIIRLLDALDEAEADLAQAWADGYNHAKVETLTLPTGDPAGVVADEAYRAGYEDGLRDARRGSRSSGGRRRRDALTGNWITPRPTHKPFTDDGVTYCGWATDHGVIDGCGEVWPCSTVRARTECVTCSGRGVWMDEPCPDCAPFYCYPCARGDHDDHKLAWVPDVPCECPECVKETP